MIVELDKRAGGEALVPHAFAFTGRNAAQCLRRIGRWCLLVMLSVLFALVWATTSR